ncbi:MAG: hypothetical protein KVP17_001523 [Porospora cf. gigantea B]|uniref:uncharacterized protein n=1 Tax=Porospora cf. gigantea B TaxID=2853592 RepID=UPI0035719A0A|nr:MAG: hypothetical protein KVP17_001523 [Porospora cf. gigantea B]
MSDESESDNHSEEDTDSEEASSSAEEESEEDERGSVHEESAVSSSGPGFDKDEGSDVTYDPEKLHFGMRRKLNRLAFRPGVDRPKDIMRRIPGAQQYKVPEPSPFVPEQTLKQSNIIAQRAAAINLEHAAAMQKRFLLREKRELIRWHLNANSKVVSIKRSWVERKTAEFRELNLECDILQRDCRRFELEKAGVVRECRKRERQLEQSKRNLLELEASYNTVGNIY